MSSLEELLCQKRGPHGGVAQRWDSSTNTDQHVHWAEFVVDVARLRDRLADAPTGGWVLLTDEAYSFAVGLFALWHSGRHAISPPNRQLGALRGPQTRASGVLTDRSDWFPDGSAMHPVLRTSGEDVLREFAAVGASFTRLDPSALAVEFYTSGTTGDEKPVLKEIRHLSDEVSELARNWDEAVAGATFFVSASHQHLYGMLFGALWPLYSGHVFQAQHFLHAGELVPRLCAAERSVLASVPTHLKRLARHGQSPQLAGRCSLIFSSGGPLPTETAHRVAELVGEAPIEVFGSTETGGVAWRRQNPSTRSAVASNSAVSVAEGKPESDPGDSLWRPFGRVEISEDEEGGTLRVRSPFVSLGTFDAEGMHSFTTGDRIRRQAGGRFELLGRADRVVKVGERRLDLTRMESELRGHRWVDEIALTTLQREQDEGQSVEAVGPRDAIERSGRPDRTDAQERVAAIVVPSKAGWELIRVSGRRTFRRELRNELADAWDPVLHPRYWRLAVALPENAQGKTTQAQLRELFQEADWGSTLSDRPEMLGEERGTDFIERHALVPADLSCFPDHFPDRAVVPGVLELDWGLGLAEAWLGERPIVTKIESLKLLMPLEPEARFQIRVRRMNAKKLEIKLWFGDEIFAKARVCIADQAE